MMSRATLVRDIHFWKLSTEEVLLPFQVTRSDHQQCFGINLLLPNGSEILRYTKFLGMRHYQKQISLKTPQKDLSVKLFR